MYEKYDYNWKSVTKALFTSLIGLGICLVFLYFKERQLTLPMWVIFFVVGVFYVFREMYFLTRINFTEFDADISFFVPIRKGKRVHFDEIQLYREVKIRDKAIMGFIELKEGKRIMLTRSGIQDFDKLTVFLSDKFPVVCNQKESKNKQ